MEKNKTKILIALIVGIIISLVILSILLYLYLSIKPNSVQNDEYTIIEYEDIQIDEVGEIEEAIVIIEEKIYKNDFFPEFNVAYLNDWSLTEKLNETEGLKEAKDLVLNFEKENYLLEIVLRTVPPMGFEPWCYADGEFEYVRIQDQFVRVYDGEAYSYGYLYDAEYDREYFETQKEEYAIENAMACGDKDLLISTPTTFMDTEFFTQEYFSAVVGASLFEKGNKNAEIILEADDIVKSFLEKFE